MDAKPHEVAQNQGRGDFFPRLSGLQNTRRIDDDVGPTPGSEKMADERRSVLAGLSDETKHRLITLEPWIVLFGWFGSCRRGDRKGKIGPWSMMRCDVMLSGTKHDRETLFASVV